MMKIGMMVVATFLATTGLASAGNLTVNGHKVTVDFVELCQMVKSGEANTQLNGLMVSLGLTDDSHLVVGGTVLSMSCRSVKPIMTGGGNSGTTFSVDTSPMIRPEPIGDGAGNPTPDPDPVENPTPAGDGDPATDNGNERPPQGGDVDGYEADNSDTTDHPPPAGN